MAIKIMLDAGHYTKYNQGAYKSYYEGDKVKFEGKVYESLIDNNVWSPADYPAGWKEVV